MTNGCTFLEVLSAILMIPVYGCAQTPPALDRWEFSLDNRVGAPVGRLQVGEFPPANGSAGGAPGTHLRLSGLGIHVSETVEASAAFHLTPDDAIRASSIYDFLRVISFISDTYVYNVWVIT